MASNRSAEDSTADGRTYTEEPGSAMHWLISGLQRMSMAAHSASAPRRRSERRETADMRSAGCETAPPRGSGDGAVQGAAV